MRRLTPQLFILLAASLNASAHTSAQLYPSRRHLARRYSHIPSPTVLQSKSSIAGSS